MKTLKLSLILILSLQTISWADTVDGTATAQFLRLGQGARPQGMGGAFSAVADDVSASYWNPAGLAFLQKQEVTFTHLQFIESIKSEYVAYALPLKKIKSTLSAAFTYLNLGDFDKRDASGASLGSGSLSAMAASAGYSIMLTPQFGAGVNAKYVQQDLDVETGSGVAFDAGLLFHLMPERLSLGAAISNVGGKIKTGTESEDLPTTIRGGLAFRPIPKKLLLAVDAEQPLDSDLKIRLGSEYFLVPLFAIRLGYEQQASAGGGLTAGLGIQLTQEADRSSDDRTFGANTRAWSNKGDTFNWGAIDASIDYAFVNLQEFDDVHRFTVTLKF